jgi:DNA-binding transcriptional LysR family regulator
MVGFSSSKTGNILPLEFQMESEIHKVILPTRIVVNDSDSMVDLARLGFGLVQAPYYRFAKDIEEKRLVEVLPNFRPPPSILSALYPQRRQPSARLRVFLEWIGQLFSNQPLLTAPKLQGNNQASDL